MPFEFNPKIDEGYTGPLMVAASLGSIDKHDPGSHSVILLGLAHCCEDIEHLKAFERRKISVRMEMTPEEAQDLAKSLWRLAKSAMRPPSKT
jgi:hypothetical protein